jgi:Predicted membrane protein
MLVKYYKNPDLVYSSRKRFKTFDYIPFAEEEQRSVLLGDGATTSVKTKVENLSDYVTIDDTRWFVMDYIYMNGKQVTMHLQRDVIGENGVGDCFGKVERGMTDGILKYRKELNLNEVLKERISLNSNKLIYGDNKISTNENELWGILYFVKPSGIDPNTGEEYPDYISVNIPGFNPNYIATNDISNGDYFLVKRYSNVFFDFFCDFEYEYAPEMFKKFYAKIRIKIDIVNDAVALNERHKYSYEYEILNNNNYDFNLRILLQSFSVSGDPSVYPSENDYNYIVENFAVMFYEILDSYNFMEMDNVFEYLNPIHVRPDIVVNEPTTYDNKIIKKNNKYYKVTYDKILESVYGAVNVPPMFKGISDYVDFFYWNNNKWNSRFRFHVESYTYYDETLLNYSNNIIVDRKIYQLTEISELESGDLIIPLTGDLIDEPYSIIVFPLFDVSIYNDFNGYTYNVESENAFIIFNTVIQHLSGDNPFLIDAQIFPYCPNIDKVVSVVFGYPFFSIDGNYSEHNISVDLSPDMDVKKEYINRKYSIISPEQTGKYDFNFYDYVNEGNNILNLSIKTSLKPFSIISSCLVVPNLNSLKGITYLSDLRGVRPSANGFQVSIATNNYENYLRQNSNYQQIFKLQQEELALSNATERVNETTARTVNTITATAMGAIGGGSIGSSIGGMIGGLFGAPSIGSAILGGAGTIGGGAAAGNVVNNAMTTQIAQNDKLRAYEENLQKQMFDLQIGTIKNLPNTINRISSFNEIILKDFRYIVEIYECTDEEKILVDNFIDNYGYGIGVFANIQEFSKDGKFIRSTLVRSPFHPILHNVATNELMGGVYIYD